MNLNESEKEFLNIILELEKLKLNSDHESFTVNLLEDFSGLKIEQIRTLIGIFKQKKIFDYVGNNLTTYTLHISDETKNILNKE